MLNKKVSSYVFSYVFALSAAFHLSPAQAQQNSNEKPAQLVSIDTVNQELISETIWVPGTVLSMTDSELSSEVAGRITWMANVGDRIQAGQPLAKLDDKRLAITQSQNKADIAKWEARVALLETRTKRFESMSAINTSKDEFDAVKAELLIAKQELAQAQANLELTEYELAQTRLTTPFDVLIVERLQSPGEFTSAGEVLLRVVDPTRIEVSVRAPLSVLPYVAQGIEVPVKDSVNQMVKTVRTVVPVGNALSRMMELRVALNADDFAIGGAVRVGLPNSSAHQGLTVPRDALVLRKSGTFVYQVDENNHAQQIPVSTGAGMGARIEVSGNLVADNPVVVRGAERLQAGDLVRVSDKDDKSSEVAKLL